jgi:hypothetical protein
MCTVGAEWVAPDLWLRAGCKSTVEHRTQPWASWAPNGGRSRRALGNRNPLKLRYRWIGLKLGCNGEKVSKNLCFATGTVAHCWGWPSVTH